MMLGLHAATIDIEPDANMHRVERLAQQNRSAVRQETDPSSRRHLARARQRPKAHRCTERPSAAGRP